MAKVRFGDKTPNVGQLIKYEHNSTERIYLGRYYDDCIIQPNLTRQMINGDAGWYWWDAGGDDLLIHASLKK